jgi:general secretion pathway protein H
VPRQRRRVRAFTLVEILVVITIVALMMGASVYSFRAVTKSELRGSASKLAGAIRYCFDRSVTTGAYFRIVLDLDGNKYWAERSSERFYLSSGKEKAPGRGQAFDVDADEARKAEDDKKVDDQLKALGGVAATLDPPPRPKRAKFQTFKDATLPQVKLKKARLIDVLTPRQPEAYSKGRAYLYFFPDGHTENAVVRLSDGDAWYSLVVHPLTGRVELRPQKVELRTDFGERDEEGKNVVPR